MPTKDTTAAETLKANVDEAIAERDAEAQADTIQFSVTVTGRNPRGFREAGKRNPTNLQPGERAELTFPNTPQVMRRLKALRDAGQVTLRPAGERDPLDHDFDGFKGGDPRQRTRTPRQTPPPPAPRTAEEIAAETDRVNAAKAEAEAAANALGVQADQANVDEAGGGLDFDGMEDEALRTFIEAKTGKAPHVNTGHKKLVTLATEANAAKAD